MSSNNLAVKITADVVELQTKFAVARAEVNSLTAEMNKLARASAQGIIDPAGTARLQQVAADMLHAKQQASGLAGELSKAGVSVGGFAGSMERGHGSIATATREFRALFDELSSGRTRQTPGTLAIIASRVLGLGPAALLTVGAVGALVATLGYLAARSIQAGEALSRIKISADFAGNFNLSAQAISAFVDSASKAANISKSDARTIAEGLAAIPGIATPTFEALSRLLGTYAQQSGEDAEKIKASLVKAFEPKETAAEFAKTLPQLTQAQIDSATAADRSGNSMQVQAEKLQMLLSVLNRASTDIAQANSHVFTGNWTRDFQNLWQYAMGGYAGRLETQAKLLAQNQAATEANATAVRQYVQELQKAQQSPEITLKAGVESATKENPTTLQVQEARSQIDKMNAALEIARERGDKVNVELLNSGLQKAREGLEALQMGPVLDRMREQMAQVAATWDGTQSGMLSKQLEIAQRTLGSVRAGSKEYIDIKREEARLELQIRQQTGSEVVAQAREQATQISGDTSRTALERLQAEDDVLKKLISDERLTAVQRREVIQEEAAKTAQIARDSQTQLQAIRRSDSDTDVAISRLRMQTARQAAEEETADTISEANRRAAALKALSEQEYSLDRAQLQSELATLNASTAEYERVYNQIRELDARHQLELTQLDRKAASERQRLMRDDVTVWQRAVGEIETAESSLISNMLTGRRTLSQSLLQISSTLLMQELQNDVRATTTRIAMQNTEEAQKKALEQGGFLYHLLFEGNKTRETLTQSAARNAAVTASQSAQAAAVATGEATQLATSKTAAVSQIMTDAAVAGAGAAASVAAIPFVGWAMAPGVGAETYALTSAYAGLAALDVGAWNVPHDMPAYIHAGESVVPKTFAQGMRENGGFGGGGGDTHHHNYNFNVDATDARSFESMVNQPRNKSAIVKMLTGHFGNGR